MTKLRLPRLPRVSRRRRPESDPTAGGLVPRVKHADRFTFTDLFIEATTGIGSRPTRLVMTTIGTVLGIGSLVVTIGFAQTAAGQIASQFDAVSSTQVVAKPAESRTGTGQTVAAGSLPWDAPERAERLAGVDRAGLYSEIDLGSLTITAVPIYDPSAAQTVSPTLVAASEGLLDAVRGTITTGRFFDSGHDARGDRVAVLGARAAERLGVNRIDRQPSIFIGGIAYAVIGIADNMQRLTSLQDAVIIPAGAARADFALKAPGELQVKILTGAGPQLSTQLPIALAPSAPDTIEVSAPSASSELGKNVQADVNLVFVVLGAIALLAGGLGIANVTMMSVMERTGEIGLRRALGATRRQIASQFVVESVVIGLLGGLIGAALGVFAVVTVSIIQQWTPVVDPWIAAGSPVLGALVGLVAGWFPARRAAHIEPVAALRGA